MAETTLEPKYKIGDVLFFPITEKKTHTHSCPDCLGSKRWKVTTPGGSDFSVKCERCDTYFRSDFGSLDYEVHEPSVRTVIIDGLKINEYGNGKVEYLQISMGGGSYAYEEHKLFESKDDALAAAAKTAEEKNAEERAKADNLKVEKRNQFSHLKYQDAAILAAEHVKYEYGRQVCEIRESIEEILDDVSLDDAEKFKKLRVLAGVDE